MYMFFFFKQKTAYEMRISDWSSDVCSSDLIDFDRILAAALGAIHGLVGRVDQLAYGARHFGRNQQRAHATCHRIARLRQHGRQAGVNIAGDALALRDRRHAHQQCKFIAANTADQIFAAHDRGYPLGERTQDFVAGKVAGTVVRRLDIIEVEKNEQERQACKLGRASRREGVSQSVKLSAGAVHLTNSTINSSMEAETKYARSIPQKD